MNQSINALLEERAEHVYFLDEGLTQAFIDGVSQHLELECFHPHESKRSEPPAHYITTLYFDSDSRALARACEGGTGGIRLRARQYRDAGIHRDPVVWLEVKTRSGASTRKVRFAMVPQDVGIFLRDGVITEHVFSSRDWQASAEPVLREIAELCTNTAAPLRPDCMVHYRRRAWQDAAHTLRITLDTELAFHRPPNNPFQTGMALSEAVLEPPVADLRHSLVEIKQRSEPPAWLGQLIDELGLELAFGGQQAFSKFVAASRAVHDRANEKGTGDGPSRSL